MKGSRLARAAAMGLACLALLWLSVAVTVAGVFRDVDPVLALKLMPIDARALGKAAQAQFTQPDRRPDLAAAEQQARAALARDPTAIDAVTSLGFVVAYRNDLPRAERIFRYAERLSRRNRETHIWLIERQVRRNDIDGALAQYDTALRTSNTLRAHLFPILMSAMSDPNIAIRLNRLLRTHPNWYLEFASKVALEARDPVAMATVVQGLFDPRHEDHRLWLTALLTRLAQLNRIDLAWRAYETLPGMADAARAPLRDGNFKNDAGLPPFDWAYAAEPHLAPERRSLGASSDGFALYMPDTLQAGEVAHQALRLAPQTHRLAATVGGVAGDHRQRPYIQIRCAAGAQTQLLRQTLPDAGEAGASMQAVFTVPPGCPYQWISIGVQARPGDERPASTWIARLSIR